MFAERSGLLHAAAQFAGIGQLVRGEGQFMHIPRREDKLETLAQQLKLLLWLLSLSRSSSA